ncbi:hypothetical protein GOBAR_DD25944 [Gossypium barbadense]|nr:hypothetical protein GOBAR_DD25944 [Gossypium barbadense]
MEPQEPEENITHMDASLYMAAAKGNIEEFNNKQGLQLESLKTPNNDNVLHVNLATHELAAWLFDIFFSILNLLLKKFVFVTLKPVCRSVEHLLVEPSLRNFITMIKREKRSDFIEQILTKCPSLLLQTNAKGQTPLHVAAKNGHSAIVKLLIKSCAKARDGDLELGMDQVCAVREMLRITDQESNTALHEAARCGNVEVVIALLEFEDPDFPYSANKKQETPLYIAARRRGSGRLLTLLLDKFKSTAHGGPHGRTALHAAAMAEDAGMLLNIAARRRGSGRLLTLLLDKFKSTAHGGPHGRTALHAAAMAEDAGDKKWGMTPLLMAARQGYLGTVSKILSLCPDCCEKVDNEGLNLLHYLAFRGFSNPLRPSLFKPGGIEIVYGSVKNLMELEDAFGMTPQEVYNALRSRKYHHKQKKIIDLLEKIGNDQVAEEPVRRFPLPNDSTESLEKKREAHLVVAALIATVTFAAAITVPGGLRTEKGPEQSTPKKGSDQGTPFLIQEVAFKAFVITNVIAFIFSVSALTTHFGVLDNLLARFSFWRLTVSDRIRSVSGVLGYATLAMVIAFSTGSYVVLKSSPQLNIVSYLICPGFLLSMWLILNATIYE